MSKKETFETLGTYIIFTGIMIPVFFNNVSTIIWIMIVGIGFGFLVSGLKKAEENHE